MKIDQGLCCIADYDGKNHFHMYSFPDFNYLYSFGKKGKPNDEIITLLDAYNNNYISRDDLLKMRFVYFIY